MTRRPAPVPPVASRCMLPTVSGGGDLGKVSPIPRAETSPLPTERGGLRATVLGRSLAWLLAVGLAGRNPLTYRR